MELTDVMRTTFSAREFTDAPVDDATLYGLLETARFAPSGGNRQGWRVIIVRERETKEQLAAFARPTMQRYYAQIAAGESPWNPLAPPSADAETIAQTEVPGAVIEQVVNAPVVLVICLDLNAVAAMDQHLDRIGIISGASVYPFAWNILLAARDAGLGGTMTTHIVPQEAGVKELLGIPNDVAVAALLPLGYPAHRLTKLRRKPVEAFTMHERWGGAPLEQ